MMSAVIPVAHRVARPAIPDDLDNGKAPYIRVGCFIGEIIRGTEQCACRWYGFIRLITHPCRKFDSPRCRFIDETHLIVKINATG